MLICVLPADKPNKQWAIIAATRFYCYSKWWRRPPLFDSLVKSLRAFSSGQETKTGQKWFWAARGCGRIITGPAFIQREALSEWWSENFATSALARADPFHFFWRLWGLNYVTDGHRDLKGARMQHFSWNTPRLRMIYAVSHLISWLESLEIWELWINFW